MYKVKEKHQFAIVRVTPPGQFGNKIMLSEANQAQLKYLYETGHPAVEKIETKKETKE